MGWPASDLEAELWFAEKRVSNWSFPLCRTLRKFRTVRNFVKTLKSIYMQWNFYVHFSLGVAQPHSFPVFYVYAAARTWKPKPTTPKSLLFMWQIRSHWGKLIEIWSALTWLASVGSLAWLVSTMLWSKLGCFSRYNNLIVHKVLPNCHF